MSDEPSHEASDRVVVSTLVRATPAEAFRLFTDEVDAWWRRGPRHRFGQGARPGGTMCFVGAAGGRLLERFPDGTEVLVGRVRAWEPGVRLVLEWLGRAFQPGQKTEVEVRFSPHPSGTRVELEHRGFTPRPRAFLDGIGLFWADLLVALAARPPA